MRLPSSRRSASHLVVLLAAVGLCAGPLVSTAGADGAESQGFSVGTPQAGRLLGGALLPDRGPGWAFQTNRGNPEARWGTAALVRTILFAVSAVGERHPGGTLVVQDLSLPGGGAIQGHASHTSGRDADLRYYAVGADGGPIVTPRDVAFGGDGRARTGGPERFDDARNWALVAGLLESPWADVKAIFILPALEHRLVAYGRRHAARSVVELAARRMQPPGSRRAAPHDDHLHVRIACPADDVARGCADRGARRIPAS